MSYLLGLDVGTTGVRCVAIDEKGIVQAASSVEHPSYAPRPGWSEQEPEDWWTRSRRPMDDWPPCCCPRITSASSSRAKRQPTPPTRLEPCCSISKPAAGRLKS